MHRRAFPLILMVWPFLFLFGLFGLVGTQKLLGTGYARAGEAGQYGRAGGSSEVITATNVVITDVLPAVYLPMIRRDLQYVAGEPNDECGAAYPIQPNLDYFFLPEDMNDWYHFDLPLTSHLVVSVTNFIPELGQVAVYRGSPSCGDYIFLENYGTPGTTKMVDVGQQPAGHYYIYVSNDGPPTDIPYTLRANFTP